MCVAEATVRGHAPNVHAMQQDEVPGITTFAVEIVSGAVTLGVCQRHTPRHHVYAVVYAI